MEEDRRSFSASREGLPSGYPSDQQGSLQVSCHQAADPYHTLRQREEREREREREKKGREKKMIITNFASLQKCVHVY